MKDRYIYIAALIKHLDETGMNMGANLVRTLNDDFVQLEYKMQLQSKKVMLYCETCSGSGEIDESLGGIPIEYRSGKCPDCNSNGYNWIDIVKFGA